MHLLRSLAPVTLCIALASASLAGEGQDGASFSLNPTAKGTEMSFAGGKVFHVARGELRGVQTIAVPGSAGQVMIWEERGPTGAFQAWYAISLDGKSVAAAKSTSYSIEMRRASFDPLRRVPDFSDSVLPAGGSIYFVQFVTQALPEYRTALEAAGATIYDHVVNHTFLVRMSPEVRDAVQALPIVRWVGSHHAEFRLEEYLLANLTTGALAPTLRYNVVVWERGMALKAAAAARIEELGGAIDRLHPEGFILEATLTPQQLAAVATFDEVAFVDRWGAPEEDMDIARNFSNANYVETLGGFSGQGVRGEVLDGGCDSNHPDIPSPVVHSPNGSSSAHGTATGGIVFGTGVNNAAARGILSSGKLIFGNYSSLSGIPANRHNHTAELVNPNLPYLCVFQSNSWGDPVTTQYNAKSQEIDDIIFINDIVILNSQSNQNSQLSRPQAWGKNIVSVGGINHQNTLTDTDDNWGGASIGPAADGRIKPDLAHFYDNILCTDQVSGGYAGGNYYSSFSGTSGATPITAGYFGLFFQMWHQNVFNNNPTGTTVFESRPHSTLAKAAMINTATQWYNDKVGFINRYHQGWGRPDAKTLYDLAGKTFFVNETDVLTPLQTKTYLLGVAAGEPFFRVTLCYLDPKGLPSPAISRINDLTLKVTAPDGTVYWGNNGLITAKTSSQGGAADTKNTVENVFIANPISGQWVVEVSGDDINTDSHPETPALDADFSLWVTGITGGCVSGGNTYCFAKLNSNLNVAKIGSTGTPTVTAQNFVVTMIDAVANKSCLVFWGNASASTPFQGGVLCVAPPHQRGPVTTTDGNGAASQPITIDVGMAGTTLYYQWWYRDPQDPSGFASGLSDALRVSFCE
jgi:hypothetical protein